MSHNWSSDLKLRLCRHEPVYNTPCTLFVIVHTMSTDDIVRWRGLRLQLKSLHLYQERFLQLATLHKRSAQNGVLARGKMEAMSTSAWEAIPNACKSSNANCNCQGAEDQPLEPERSPEDEDEYS